MTCRLFGANIIWTNARIFLDGPRGKNLNFNRISHNLINKNALERPPAKGWPFCLGLNVFKRYHLLYHSILYCYFIIIVIWLVQNDISTNLYICSSYIQQYVCSNACRVQLWPWNLHHYSQYSNGLSWWGICIQTLTRSRSTCSSVVSI